ncbi:hypothetical protein H4R33_002799 [Dimargaris cristalligena]|nr:hypothetical protein H4R33_002799 [Dimargaris cristalligena]
MKFTTSLLALVTISVYAQVIATSIPIVTTNSPTYPLVRCFNQLHVTIHQLVRRTPQNEQTSGSPSTGPSNTPIQQPTGKANQQLQKRQVSATKAPSPSKFPIPSRKPAAEPKISSPSKIPVPVKKPSATSPPSKQPANGSAATGQGRRTTKPSTSPSPKPMFVGIKYPGNK